MKLIVFSDAHGQENMVDRILNFNPDADYILSLGDSQLNHDYLLSRDIVHVKGNINRDPGFVYETDVTVGDIRIFLTHGHKFKVQRTLDKLRKHAVSSGYQVALFGHTHIPYKEQSKTITMVNPGSCASPRNSLPPTYAILVVEGTKIEVTFKDVWTNKTIELK